MLIRFIINNFRSFGEETVFDMLTGNIRRKKEHIYQFGDIELLKTAAIYGANGAGKSNLVEAISLLQDFIVDNDETDFSRFESFRLSPKLQNKPTQFEVEFIINQMTYSYGLAVLDGRILEEWLFKVLKRGEERIFERQLTGEGVKIIAGRSLLKTPEDTFRIKLYEEELLSDQQTLLHMLSKAKKVNTDVDMAFTWFNRALYVIDPYLTHPILPFNYYKYPRFKRFVDQLLSTFDTGVEKIVLKTVGIHQYFGVDDIIRANSIEQDLLRSDKEYEVIEEPDARFLAFAVKEGDQVVVKRLVTVHKVGDKEIEFEISSESDGTQRLLDFVTMLFQAIYFESVHIIDEIDQSLHPHLLKKLISKFVNDHDARGQLIFTTHDSNLLDQDIFRQDEIWFAEKKKSGETTLYPLSDFKIRYDLDIEKGYLNGRFGAIPFLGNLDDLNWRVNAS